MTNLNASLTVFSVEMSVPPSFWFQAGDGHQYKPDAAGRLMARAADVPSLIEAGATRAAAAGPTAGRPLDQLHPGFQYFDTDRGAPVFWSGGEWVDAMGGAA